MIYYDNNPHIPKIHALNSDTHTLFLSILILNSECVGVAHEVIDIWYIGVTTAPIVALFYSEISKTRLIETRNRVSLGCSGYNGLSKQIIAMSYFVFCS